MVEAGRSVVSVGALRVLTHIPYRIILQYQKKCPVYESIEY